MPTGVVPNSGNLLMEMVCDVCQIEGFIVEKNVETEANTGNFVDIVASRNSDGRAEKIAFECWEKDSQVDAKQIENFVQRLRDLDIRSGIYVCPKGFTANAEYVARRLGVELWDMVKLREHLGKIQTPEKTQVPGTLPVSRTLPATIFSRQLENGTALKMRSLPRLEFRPYYFARFEAAGGRKRKGAGVIVLDGVDGRVCDAGMLEGRLNGLPSTGMFMECLQVEPSVGHLPKLPDGLGMSNTVTVAPPGLAQEQAKTLAKTVLQTEAGVGPDEANVTDVSILHVPIVTLDLSAGTKSYRKVVQAATGRMIWDETAKCCRCEKPSRAICEVCGSTVCEEHMRLCSSCQKHLCNDCVETRGVLSKQPFCPTCKKD